MPFQDLASQHPTDAERAQVDNLLAQLEAILQPYMRNLSPEENKRLGRINKTNRLAVDKVHEFHLNMPALQSPDVDWQEFDRDYATRQFYDTRASRLASLAKAMTETRRLHDHDNFANALIDYGYAQYKEKTEVGVGYDTKVAQIGQFFAKRGASTLDDGTATDDEA